MLNIDGPVALNGNLSILLDNGFIPLVGSIYKFMSFTPGELSGTFGAIQNPYFNDGKEMWSILYDNADGFVQLTAVPSPEPYTALLLMTGLVPIAGRALRPK